LSRHAAVGGQGDNEVKNSKKVAPNLLNQKLNLVGRGNVYAGNVTYLRTAEGWMYLAIVTDLYSPRTVAWHIDKRITIDLISKALLKAYNLRQPPLRADLSYDRQPQYTGKRFE
jgi:putative transposase